MADPKSRARVERLLRGDFRTEDLTQLFLYARDRCDGREPVAEIGHFVAHHSERDKGIVTRSTREWFAVMRFHAPQLAQPAKQLDARAMPPATREYFKIAVNRIDAKIIRSSTGLRRADAYKAMNEIADRLSQNQDGTWSLPANLNPNEVDLINCVISNIVAKPAFLGDRLCDDFTATLKSNGLITNDESRRHKDLIHTLVQLFAVAAMHNCVVQIGDGTTTQLKARALGQEINVNAVVPDAVPGIMIATSMFTAHLDPAVHCHPHLVADGDWAFEIELAQDMRLSPLR